MKSAHAFRLPFGLSPLASEADRRRRERRLLGVALLLLLAGCAAAAALLLRSASSPGAGGPTPSAGLRQQYNSSKGWSMRYPSGMHVEHSAGAGVSYGVDEVTFASFRSRHGVLVRSFQHGESIRTVPARALSGRFPGARDRRPCPLAGRPRLRAATGDQTPAAAVELPTGRLLPLLRLLRRHAASPPAAPPGVEVASDVLRAGLDRAEGFCSSARFARPHRLFDCCATAAESALNRRLLALVATVLFTAACGASGKPSALPPHPTTISARQAEDLVSAAPISKRRGITVAGLWRVTDPRLFIPEHGIHRLLIHNQVGWIVLVRGVNERSSDAAVEACVRDGGGVHQRGER